VTTCVGGGEPVMVSDAPHFAVARGLLVEGSCVGRTDAHGVMMSDRTSRLPNTRTAVSVLDRHEQRAATAGAQGAVAWPVPQRCHPLASPALPRTPHPRPEG
jgi:hypothetical protein